jgi:hypothetical protein
MPTPFYNLPDVRGRIGRLALQHRLPSMCEEVSYVRDGCLLSYGPDFTAMWRRSATYIVKILQGAKPAELLVEQPTKFNFFITEDGESARPDRPASPACAGRRGHRMRRIAATLALWLCAIIPAFA